MNTITLMVQDIGGNWMPIRLIENLGDRYILQQMKIVKSGYPGKRVKAVDSKGNLIDLMG